MRLLITSVCIVLVARSNIMRLMEARVDGIIVKHDTTDVTRPYPSMCVCVCVSVCPSVLHISDVLFILIFTEQFSPEHRCPNSLFGESYY